MWSFGTDSIPLRVKRGSIAESSVPGRDFHTPMGAPPLVGPGTTGLARGARCSAGDTAVASPTGGEVALAAAPWDRRMSGRERWMALAFAAGSACFLVGPFPGYLALVGPLADALTFFVGSVLFTVGGALQVLIAARDRRAGGAG